MKLAGDAPLWRWRFLSAPPSVARAGERLQCRVALTDEYGSLIKPNVARAVLGEGFRVRCEVWPKLDSLAREQISPLQSAQEAQADEGILRASIVGQRSDVPSTEDVCQWYFKPKLPLECTGESSEVMVTVMVRGERSDEQAVSPWLVLAVESSPVRVICTSKTDNVISELTLPPPPSLCSTRHFEFRTESSTPSMYTAQNQATICVSIREEFGASLGAHVWNSGLVLAQWLCHERARLLSSQVGGHTDGRYPTRVLEIGSGCGVASIVASRLDADVTATDLPPVLPLLLHNVKANIDTMRNKSVETSDNQFGNLHAQGGSCSVCPLDWTSTTNAESLRNFDMVLAADVLYGPAAYAPLLSVLDAMLAPDGVAVIALSHRDHGQAVEEAVLRAANTPNMHPFFRRAGGEFDDELADETQSSSGKPAQTLWRATSVYFFANVEVLELTRIQ